MPTSRHPRPGGLNGLIRPGGQGWPDLQRDHPQPKSHWQIGELVAQETAKKTTTMAREVMMSL